MDTKRGFQILTFIISSLLLISCGGRDKAGGGILDLKPPFELSAKSGDGKITLSWQSKSSQYNYRIYYGAASKDYSGSESTSGASPVLVDKKFKDFVLHGLANGKKYYIAMTSFSKNDESNYSVEVTAVPKGLGSTSDLSVSPELMNISCTEGDTSTKKGNISISNAGSDDDIYFNVTEHENWLSVSPVSGISDETVEVFADCSSLTAGSNPSADITVTGNEQTKIVSINLTVNAPNSNPDLSVSPAVISTSCTAGDGNQDKADINVSNAGTGGAISFSTFENANWLSLSPTSGSTDLKLDVYINCSSLSAGSYSQNVTVSGNGENENVTVNLTVNNAGTQYDLAIDKTSLNLTCTEGDGLAVKDQIYVSNAGYGGAINFESGEGANWLSVNPVSGQTDRSVDIGIDCTNLSYGDNLNATITFSGNYGGSEQADVYLSVGEIPDNPPAAPTALWANLEKSYRIKIGWSDNSENEDGFKIERSLDGSNFSQIDTVGQGIATYTNSGLNADTTYYYRVRAYNAEGNSAYSNVANAHTPDNKPPAPTGVSADGGDGLIIVSWNAVAGAASYNIYYGTSPGTYGSPVNAGSNTSYEITGLANGITYYLAVKSVNLFGESADFSNEVSATPGQYYIWEELYPIHDGYIYDYTYWDCWPDPPESCIDPPGEDNNSSSMYVGTYNDYDNWPHDSHSYMRFDLSGIDMGMVREAELSVVIKWSGGGMNSQHQNLSLYTISDYGVLDYENDFDLPDQGALESSRMGGPANTPLLFTINPSHLTSGNNHFAITAGHLMRYSIYTSESSTDPVLRVKLQNWGG